MNRSTDRTQPRISIRLAIFGGILALSSSLLGCSIDSAKSRYLLAEKLYNDGKYAAAVNEFEKVVVKEPRGKLGLQALFRAAITQAVYLNQYAEAVRKFRSYVEASTDQTAIWEAQRQIGDILFVKTEQYEQAIPHYRLMLKVRGGSLEAPEMLYRIAKSHFFLYQFDEAITTYEELIKRHSGSKWAEQAAYQIGMTHFTRAGKSGGLSVNESFQDAMDAFQGFLKKFPKSPLVPEARFGIASCLEELDQLDAAYHQYEALRNLYPSPKVIEIKLARIKERKEQRSR